MSESSKSIDLNFVMQISNHPVEQKDVEIGAYAIVGNRMCKIVICQCNEQSKKIYIRCDDIETNKMYSLFVSNSIFDHANYPNGTSCTVIQTSLDHIKNYKYIFRQKTDDDNIDPENPDSVEMFAVGKSNVILGCYLRHTTTTGLYRILDFSANDKTISFKCEHIYTKQCIIYDVVGDYLGLTNSNIGDTEFLIFGETIVSAKLNKNITCCDGQKNGIEFVY